MSDGLAVLEANRWQRVMDGEVALQDDVRCLVEDGRGHLYFGTHGRGLGRLRLADRVTVHFTRDEGLGSSTVHALFADSEGTIWAGTQGGGLARVTDRWISRIRPEQGIQHETVCQILEDHTGRIWLATLGAVVSATKSDLNDCADGKSSFVATLLFDLHEGFTRVDFVGGNQPAAARTSDNRLWFVAGKGLGVVDPDEATSCELGPPPMVIENVRVGDVNLQLSTGEPNQPLRLLPGAENLEISYNALSYVAPRRVRFQYQLAGVDDDWVDAGPGRKVRFAQLPPGSYTFRVRGSNSDGIWNTEGATLKLILAPYFWQTAWFRLLLLVLGIASIAGAVYGFARVRHRRKLMLVEQRETLERERGRIARDMHDEVGAKLTRITVLSRLVLRRNLLSGKSAELLTGLADAARECVRRFDQIVWTVNPQNDSLQDLADYLANDAISYFDNTGVELRLKIPDELPELPVSATQRNNLLHAYEEAMSNALRHSGAHSVEISMKLEGAVFRVIVKDDGQWRERPETSGPRHGLDNMQTRMSDIGGQCAIERSQGSGTLVRLRVPLPNGTQ
jgi:signal transduction histidine kinase